MMKTSGSVAGAFLAMSGFFVEFRRSKIFSFRLDSLGWGSLSQIFFLVKKKKKLSWSFHALSGNRFFSGGEFLLELQHTHFSPSWNERH